MKNLYTIARLLINNLFAPRTNVSWYPESMSVDFSGSRYHGAVWLRHSEIVFKMEEDEESTIYRFDPKEFTTVNIVNFIDQLKSRSADPYKCASVTQIDDYEFQVKMFDQGFTVFDSKPSVIDFEGKVIY